MPRTRSNTNPETSCPLELDAINASQNDWKNESQPLHARSINRINDASKPRSNTLKSRKANMEFLTQRSSVFTLASSPLLTDKPLPPLQLDEENYLIAKADQSSSALLRCSNHIVNGSKWQPLGKYRDISLYRGTESRLGAMTFSEDTPSSSVPAQPTNVESLAGSMSMIGTIEDVIKYFAQNSNSDLKYKQTDDVLESKVLYSLVQGRPRHPNLKVIVKYAAWEAPTTWARNRDMCYIECQNTFQCADGRRGWALSMHSIQMPACPERPGCVRCSIYNSGYVFTESSAPGYLDVLYILQINFKGHLPVFLVQQTLKRKITNLLRIYHGLLFCRIQHRTILRPQELLPKSSRSKCHCCARKFNPLFFRKTRCRMCGDVACHTCAPLMDYQSIDKNGRVIHRIRICAICFRTSDSISEHESNADSLMRIENASGSYGDKGHHDRPIPNSTYDRQGTESTLETFLWMDDKKADSVAMLERRRSSLEHSHASSVAMHTHADQRMSSRYTTASAFSTDSKDADKRTSERSLKEMTASERMEWIQKVFSTSKRLQNQTRPSQTLTVSNGGSSQNRGSVASRGSQNANLGSPSTTRGSKMLISKLNYDMLDYAHLSTSKLKASSENYTSPDDIPMISANSYSSVSSLTAELPESIRLVSHNLNVDVDAYVDPSNCILEPESEPAPRTSQIGSSSFIEPSLDESDEAAMSWNSGPRHSIVHFAKKMQIEEGDEEEQDDEDEEIRSSVFCDSGPFQIMTGSTETSLFDADFEGEEYICDTDYRPSASYSYDGEDSLVDDAMDDGNSDTQEHKEPAMCSTPQFCSSNLQRLQDRMGKEYPVISRDTEMMVVIENDHEEKMKTLKAKTSSFIGNVPKDLDGGTCKNGPTEDDDWRTSAFIKKIHVEHQDRMEQLKQKLQILEEDDLSVASFQSSVFDRDSELYVESIVSENRSSALHMGASL